VWNENFEFHGSLKKLLANKLEVHRARVSVGVRVRVRAP